MTSITAAVSCTVRHSGPPRSRENDSGIIPARLTNPGSRPCRPAHPGRRETYRAGGIGAHCTDRKVGRGRRARTGAGATRGALGVVGIAALPAERAAANARRRVLIQIGLAQDNCARCAQLRHDGRVARRLVVGVVGGSAGGGAHVGGVVIVLDRERNAVQRTD